VEYKLLGEIEEEGILELGRGKVISKKTIKHGWGVKLWAWNIWVYCSRSL